MDPLDRGLLFGDALYEVIKVRDRAILLLEPHLERLRSGLEQLDITPPAGIGEACRKLLAASGLTSGYLYILVSRGVAPRSHLPPRHPRPTLLILTFSHRFPAPAGEPRSAITMRDPRWGRCDLKTTSLMGTVLAKLEARAAGVDEVLFVDAAGRVREGGNTNVFVVRGGVLETHRADSRILAGVTRALVLRFARRLHLPVRYRAPRTSEAETWQELFLTGTLTGVQPVQSMDRRPIGGGRTGPWTRALALALEQREEEIAAA